MTGPTQGIPDDIETVVDFTETRFNTGVVFDPATNCLSAPEPGIYQISASVQWNSGSTVGFRSLQIQVDGVPIVVETDEAVDGDSVSTHQAVSTLWALTGEECVRVAVQQNSGGLLNIEDVEAFSPEFMMARVA